MRTIVLLRTVMAAAVAGLLAVPAMADEGTIEYREAVYTAIGGHMKALGAIVKGQVPRNEDMKPHADAIAALSEITPHLFPEGSGKGKTDAKPEIWTKADDFKEDMDSFAKAAKAMAAAAGGSDEATIAAAFGELGKACKECHDSFREKH